MKNTKTKCDFCKYYSGRSCMATPKSIYCKEAADEYYNDSRNTKVAHQARKSFRSWDRK